VHLDHCANSMAEFQFLFGSDFDRSNDQFHRNVASTRSEKARMPSSRDTFEHVAPAGTVIQLVNARDSNESKLFSETSETALSLE